MSAVAFDPLEYAEQLEAAGLSRAQAPVVAKGLTTMFIHNFDELVTKDYLDTRFSDFESRMDLRFAESESRTNSRFAELEAKMDVGFARVNVIQGILLVAVAIPTLQTILHWVR